MIYFDHKKRININLQPNKTKQQKNAPECKNDGDVGEVTKKPICSETSDSDEPPMKKEKWDGNTGEFVSDNTNQAQEDYGYTNNGPDSQGQQATESMLEQVMGGGGDDNQGTGSTGTGGGETSGGEEGQIEKVIGDNTTVIKLPAPEGPLDEEKLVYRSIEFLLDGNAKCKMCGKTFTSGPNVRRHIRTIHLNDGQINFHCFLCNKGFTMQRYLKNHLKTHSQFYHYFLNHTQPTLNF